MNRLLTAKLLCPLGMILIGTGWSAIYVFTTFNDEDFERSVGLFIGPLMIPIAGVALFILIMLPFQMKAGPPEEDTNSESLLDPKRLALAFSFLGVCIGVQYLGLAIPALIYTFVMCVVLGARNIPVICFVTVAVQIVLWGGFKYLLGIPIPMLP